MLKNFFTPFFKDKDAFAHEPFNVNVRVIQLCFQYLQQGRCWLSISIQPNGSRH